LKENLVPSKDRISFDIYSSTAVHFLPLLTGPRESIEDLLERCRQEREKGKFVTYAAAVGYDKMQVYVRSDQLLMLIATDPDWVIDMYRTDAQLAIDMYDIMVEEGFEFDGAFLYCDLGYRNATLFSPKHYREQLHPVFKMLCDYFKSKGLPIILHCGGNVNEVVPDLIEAGFTCLQPLEVKAKMDLIDLKGKYGDRLAFMGGIDVRNMAKDDLTDLEEEIRTKFEVAKKGGGYIYHSDHSIPKNVSFENYKKVIELVRKYGEY